MHKKCLCVVSSKEYYIQTKHAIQSALDHNKDYRVILVSDGIETNLADIHLSPEELGIDRNIINKSTGAPLWLVVCRPAIIKYALEKLNFDYSVFIDGDTYTYNSYTALEKCLIDGFSAVVTPHITKPIPNDGLNPSMQTIAQAGNYNSGIFAFSAKCKNFIEWWDYQTRKLPYVSVENGLAAEQGWLRFIGDFEDDVKIFRSPAYNVAYWNIAQRNFKIINNEYYVDNEKLVVFHYSGFNDKISIENLSKHQNRYKLSPSGDSYKLFYEYKKKVWGA